MKEGTYSVEVKCDNCGSMDSVGIKKGVTIREGLLLEKCSNCGCFELKKAEVKKAEVRYLPPKERLYSKPVDVLDEYRKNFRSYHGREPSGRELAQIW